MQTPRRDFSNGRIVNVGAFSASRGAVRVGAYTAAKETVERYRRMLNMDFVLAIAEDQVPSTKEPDPYMHIFMDAGGGNELACPDPEEEAIVKKLDAVKWEMLEEWSKTKGAPRHAAISSGVRKCSATSWAEIFTFEVFSSTGAGT